MTCTLLKEKVEKEFIDKGAITVGTNRIQDSNKFRELNNGYSQLFAKQYDSDPGTKPYSVDNDKAILNEEYLDQIDLKANPSLAYERRDKKGDVPQEVLDAYEANPELAEIGTAEQYAEHLKKVFPDSQVQDIVYHGTPFEFDEFKKPSDVKNNIFNQHTLENEEDIPDAIYFQFEPKPFRNGKVVPAIINSKELIKKENYSGYSISYATGNRKKLEIQLGSETFDALDITPIQDKRELLVFEPDQIHILGSKKDIELFKQNVEPTPEKTEEELLAAAKKIASRRYETSFEQFQKKFADFSTPANTSLTGSTRETLRTAQEKIEHMKKTFDVEIVEDYGLEGSGVLLGSNHPLSKRHGKPVIAINPDILFSDTVFHEFGHLYVDLLGGLQDPVVAQAIDELRDSQLWASVQNEYPELSGDNLAKEVLATALGKAGNDIYYGDQARESTWQRIKRMMIMAIKNLLGTGHQYSAIEKIASEMLTGQVRLTGAERFNSLVDQNQKRFIEKEDINQDSIRALLDEISTTFKLRDEDHVYINQDTKEIYTKSSSGLAKGFKVGRTDLRKKGKYDLDFTDADKLTKQNVNIKFDQSVLPSSLDSAIDNFFMGKIGDLSPFLTTVGLTKNAYWYTHLMDVKNNPHYDKMMSAVERNIEVINEEANRLELLKSTHTIMGNIVHEALEEYIEQRKAGNETPFPNQIVDDAGLLKTEIKRVIDEGLARGSNFYTEQILFSEEAQVPGTADLIEITKEGKFRIYDFKTTESYNDRSGRDLTDRELYVRPGYMNQLIIYSTMLEAYGLEAADNHMNIISIQLDKSKFDPSDPANSEVPIEEVRFVKIDPLDPSFSSDYKYSKAIITKRFSSANKLKTFDIKDKKTQIDDLLLEVQRNLEDYQKMTTAGRGGKFVNDLDVVQEGRDLLKLDTEIKKYIGAQNSKALFKYINAMHDVLANVYEGIQHNELTPGYVQNVNYLLQVSDTIDKVIEFVEASEDDFILEEQSKMEVLSMLRDIKDSNLKLKELSKVRGKEMVIRTLAENSNLYQGAFSEKYEVEARQNGLKTKGEIFDYVHKKLKENESSILAKELEHWNAQLTDGYTDLRFLEAQLADPGMSKSQFVQIVKNILDKVDNDIRIDLDKSIPEIVSWFDELKFEQKGEPSKVWKDLIQVAKFKDIDGNQIEYMHSSVISDKTSDYREIFMDAKFRLEHLQRKIDKAAREKKMKLVEKLKEKREEIREERRGKLAVADKTLRVNPKYAALSKEKKEALEFIYKKLRVSDSRLDADYTKKLTRIIEDGSILYELPKMRKSNTEALYDPKTMGNTMWSKVNDLFRPAADEDELGINSSEDEDGDSNNDFEDFNTSDTDIQGNPSYNIPVFYRNSLEDPTLQSFDIPTLLALNEETTIAFENKKLVEADIYLITNALKNAVASKTDAIVSKKVVDKKKNKFSKALRSEGNQTLKNVEASINNRFYKRSYVGTYSKWNYRAIKAGEALGSATSSILLTGNFASATMTAMQGSIYRFIEGVAGENFNKADAVKGSKKTYSDLNSIVSDTQKQFPESKTNLLIRRFGLETQYQALTNKFIQQNALTKNIDGAAMFAVTSVAETMVTANLMYTLLGNIKVMNDNSEYINKDGKVVAKKDAMSLDEAYTVEKGQLILNKHVRFTEKNIHTPYSSVHEGEKTIASTEISRYIRSIYADLHGQYNQDMKSMFEMTITGKLVMSMRKWLPRGAHRRWRGITSAMAYTFEEARDPELLEENIERRFYSQDQKRFQEGYYTTLVRYLYSVKQKMNEQSTGLMTAKDEVYDQMTTHERANMKRVLSELGIILISVSGAMLATIAAESLDDDDDRTQDKFYYMAYLAQRLKMETLTFIHPGEFMGTISTPAASISTMKRISDLIDNLINFDVSSEGVDWHFDDRYDRGYNKGELKLFNNMADFVPGKKQYEKAKGILGLDSDESFKETFEYTRR